MNDFDQRLRAEGVEPLRAVGLGTLQVNLGLRCNLQCTHCHLAASPSRTERMDAGTLDEVLRVASRVRPGLVDITGGAPELHAGLFPMIRALVGDGVPVQVRTNLTVLLEPGQEGTAAFYRDHAVGLVASLPCYLEEEVRAQRGPGVFERSIEALRRLNALGYGMADGLPLTLVFNPLGPDLPPAQAALEEEYRSVLGQRYGLSFTRLATLANMPVGRFREDLRRAKRCDAYSRTLADAFNRDTLPRLMCLRQVCVRWDGRLFDCDFNLAQDLPLSDGAPRSVERFDASALAARLIRTGVHCFGCTAGQGSSCGGALV